MQGRPGGAMDASVELALTLTLTPTLTLALTLTLTWPKVVELRRSSTPELAAVSPGQG